MLDSLPSTNNGSRAPKVILALLLACVLATSFCSAANAENTTVRLVGRLDGDLARGILKRVRTVPFFRSHDSPILVEGASLSRLKDAEKQELAATYRAGYTLLLLDASMLHVKMLHDIIGIGINYRSKDTGVLMAYTIRQENLIPRSTLLTPIAPSPLRTQGGDPDATALADDALALSRAVAGTLAELTRKPTATIPGPPRGPNGVIEWDENPVLTTTFRIASSQGQYNTAINVFALHRCLDNTDHYVVTAEADWTPTNAKWQSATSAEPNPSMYLDKSGNLVINWQDNDRTYCSSPSLFDQFDDVCRYINYPLSYGVMMVPRNEGTVTQIDASPPATQGQQTSYTSGFSFSVGGTVNVSTQGPGGGISGGAMWTNTTSTTVPPVIVDVSNVGNEGANWSFNYCTTGLEPDPGTDCTGHVQMVKDVCQAQLGDDSGTNPQLGQMTTGKFSSSVQSAHWVANPDTRTGSTFDIEVGFVARIGTTIAHLGRGSFDGPDPIAGCNASGCACVSTTDVNLVTRSTTFAIPLPSTACK